MDPIVAVYEITLTVRAPEGAEVEAPTVAEIEGTVAAAAVEQASGNGITVSANAIAKRTDR